MGLECVLNLLLQKAEGLADFGEILLITVKLAYDSKIMIKATYIAA